MYPDPLKADSGMRSKAAAAARGHEQTRTGQLAVDGYARIACLQGTTTIARWVWPDFEAMRLMGQGGRGRPGRGEEGAAYRAGREMLHHNV